MSRQECRLDILLQTGKGDDDKKKKKQQEETFKVFSSNRPNEI